VLIPRPETELLAEKGWTCVNSLNKKEPTVSALDLGTGSGCIGIALAVHCPAAHVVATDISAEALELARQNAARHNVLDRIEFLQGDGFTALNSPKVFELIISNPPYIPTDEIQGIGRRTRWPGFLSPNRSGGTAFFETGGQDHAGVWRRPGTIHSRSI
jgi:release factor glutamine methyltransferase